MNKFLLFDLFEKFEIGDKGLFRTAKSGHVDGLSLKNIMAFETQDMIFKLKSASQLPKK